MTSQRKRTTRKNADVQARSSRLTPQQSMVLELVGRGLSNKEISARLDVSEQRAKEIVSQVLLQFHAANRGELGRISATRRLLGEFDIDAEWLGYLFHDAPIPIALVAGPAHQFVAFNRAYAARAR